jgi:hypothetical protein
LPNSSFADGESAGSSVDEIPAEGDLTLEKKDHSDDFPETCSNTHVAPVSEEK